MDHSIKIGDNLPSFVLPNQEGKLVSIDDIKKDGNLVLYFYPKNNTIVCTKEACAFRDYYREFERYNCKIVGISSDPINSHSQFSEKYNLPFPLLSDVDNKVRNLLGVPRDFLGLLSGRYTYVIDREWVVKHITNGSLNASKHIIQSLKALKNE